MLFSNRDLRRLLIPLIFEQLLAGFMGIADTMMVTRVGASAISAVSCADAINTLMLYIFSALATGGTIVCSQYLGREDRPMANVAARQVLLMALGVSAALTVFCALLRAPLLRLAFGGVERAVMAQAGDYFAITVISYPFIALQQASAALFRAEGNTRAPMAVITAANVMNIAGNAILIFGFGLGVTGAAISTLASRVTGAAALLILQRSKRNVICIRDYAKIRLSGPVIRQVVRIGIPSGIENGLFQFGRLVVQSTVSTLGTTAIAAQAMIYTLDVLQTVPGMAIGVGALTVVGQCVGAGELGQAKRYTKKLCLYSELTNAVSAALILTLTRAITRLAGMDAASAALTFRMEIYVVIAKLTLWTAAFTLPCALRAAGDVLFTTVVSSLTMWIFRVGLGMVLCRVLGLGLLGVWLGWFADWAFRAAAYVLRFRSDRWHSRQVLD